MGLREKNRRQANDLKYFPYRVQKVRFYNKRTFILTSFKPHIYSLYMFLLSYHK